MVNSILTILTATFAALATFYTSSGDISDNSNRVSGISRIKPNGWKFIAFTLAAIVTTLIQIQTNDLQQSNEKKVQQERFDSTLAAYRKQTDSSNSQTIVNITKAQAEALGKYGYRFDSVTNRLVKIVRDSSKTKVILSDGPLLSLCYDSGIREISKKNDTTYYQISFCNQGSSSTRFKLNSYCIVADSVLPGSAKEKFYYIGPLYFLNGNISIGKDAIVQHKIYIKANRPYTHLCLYIKGTYTNLDRLKIYPIDIVCYYNVITKRTSIATGTDRESIIEFINKNKGTKQTSPLKTFGQNNSSNSSLKESLCFNASKLMP